MNGPFWRLALYVRRVTKKFGKWVTLAQLVDQGTSWTDTDGLLDDLIVHLFRTRSRSHQFVQIAFILEAQDYILQRLSASDSSAKVLFHPRAAFLAVFVERELRTRGWLRGIKKGNGLFRLELTPYGKDRLLALTHPPASRG